MKYHQSIEKIKEAIKPTEKFSSRNVKDDEVRNFIMNLDGCKARYSYWHVKTNNGYPSSHNDSNNYMVINNNCYPDDLKLVGVSPVFKKKDDLDKEN